MLNLLQRLVDGTPADQPDATPPEALALREEPQANVARYDGLRRKLSPRAVCASGVNGLKAWPYVILFQLHSD